MLAMPKNSLSKAIAIIFFTVGATLICGFVFLIGFLIIISEGDNVTSTPVEDTIEEIRKPKQTSQSTPSIRPALIAPARMPLEGDVTIEVNVTELPNKSVQVHGMTNLPTGTDLMLSIIDSVAGESPHWMSSIVTCENVDAC